MQKTLTLRCIGLKSLMVTIPAEYIRALGLKAGDEVSFAAEGDTATLKFYRVTRTVSRTPAQADAMQMPEAE